MVSLLLSIIYLAFISLGLPDSVLGAAWPSMYEVLGVPVSFAGIISMIIAFGTIISSLASDYLIKKLGVGKITAISVAITAGALMGFSFSSSFPILCLFAIPYGLGAGSVDSALNNYVALHFASRHMSWLHCMWGVGTVIGPNIMGLALTNGQGWEAGYRYVSFFQIALTVLLIITLPVWKIKSAPKVEKEGDESAPKAISPISAMKFKGAKEIMFTFFCYCALEATAMLWAGSYLNLHKGVEADSAASYASLLFIGITLGRFFSGFLTIKFTDKQMIRMGEGIITLGILVLLLPFGYQLSLCGLFLIGLGCAPVYPCIIHSTPSIFGADRSQAMIGIQMASAYTGSCLMPPVFGLIANHINVAYLPVYLLVFTLIMAVSHEILLKKTVK